ncbi:hypothetical protein HY311_00545 [Candidatus Nomurabacteria bacterium]|nr:hypothetical protein [Candidatus Nomurabacteria bacterium]
MQWVEAWFTAIKLFVVAILGIFVLVIRKFSRRTQDRDEMKKNVRRNEDRL